jgi:hypothetical protein
VAGVTIDVVASAFTAAATTYGSDHDSVVTVINTLTKALDDNWGCAGTDDTGKNFAGQYDPAALNAVDSGADIANGLAKLHDLLQYTSANHANGNHQAAVAPNPNNVAQPPAQTPAYAAPKFKGAYGGSTDAPLGWGLITRWLQGRVWPNGHQDHLHNLAHAWWDASGKLEGLARGLTDARAIVGEQVSGEVPQILTQIDLVVGDVNAAVDQYDKLGNACNDYADALTTAHHTIEKAMGEFVVGVGVSAIIGSIIGPEGTAGGAAIASGAAGAGTAARVVTLIDALATAVAADRVVLAGTAISASVLTKNLEPLLSAQPQQFNVNTRPDGQPIPPKPYRPGVDETTDFNGEQAAQDLRDMLANNGQTIKMKRNVGVAEAEIDGRFIPSSELRAVSGTDPAPTGTIGEPTNPVFNPVDETGGVVRPVDSEYKLLENLATRLKPDSTGVIDLYTEGEPCPACSDVIKQFQNKFPGVKLNVTYSVPSS